MEHGSPTQPTLRKPKLGPFRRAVLHGLGVVLPPLLTVAIFLWVGNTFAPIAAYLLDPVERAGKRVMIWSAETTGNIRSEEEVDPNERDAIDSANGLYKIDEELFRLTPDNYYIPNNVYTEVKGSAPLSDSPTGAYDIYEQYLKRTWLSRTVVIPVFLGVFILVLYLIGKFIAVGVGRLLWVQFEKLIVSVPLVRQVYSSVKQVTDFMFKEQPEIRATRVVAIEYPRKGIWSLAMVTGEGMLDIAAAANEPMLSVLVPTSPMPLTGFTMTVRKSEAIDIDISMDQAIQFIMSCGVVIPPHQSPSLMFNSDGTLKSKPLIAQNDSSQ